MTSLETLHAEHAKFLANCPAKEPMSGRGIVTSIYDAEFASGWVLLSELFRLDCTLPIQVFHRPDELSAQQIALLSDISPLIEMVSMDSPAGYSFKVMSIFKSRFQEVMWIDADNVPIRNPEFLFQDVEYLSKGSLFWRDVSGADRARFWYPGSPVWSVFEVPYNDAEEFDSGQLLIDKDRCWEALWLTVMFNANSHVYYQFVHGDKDTFRMAWWNVYLRNGGKIQQVNTLCGPFVPYGFMPYGPHHVGRPNPWGKWGGGSVMVQRDRAGEPLFNHRNINKWKIDDVYEVDLDTPQDFLYLTHLYNLRILMSDSGGA
jgi:alpha 1,2-mannosyltransferase